MLLAADPPKLAVSDLGAAIFSSSVVDPIWEQKFN